MINKFKQLAKDVKTNEKRLNEIHGDYYGSVYNVYEGKRPEIIRNTIEIGEIRKRLLVLEEIVRESGLITDFTPDEVKIREDVTHGLFGKTVKNVPYQINKAKVTQ